MDARALRLGKYRRRRYVWSIILMTLCFFGILYVKGGDSVQEPVQGFYKSINRYAKGAMGSNGKVDEFKALLYFLSHSHDTLPEDFDVDASPLDLAILSSGESPTIKEWNSRIQKMDREEPMIVFSKTYCPYSKAAKALLHSFELQPAPRIIEVDLREDAAFVKSLLTRFTSRGTFPNVLLHGESIGGSDDLKVLDASGKLSVILKSGGLHIRASHRAHRDA